MPQGVQNRPILAYSSRFDSIGVGWGRQRGDLANTREIASLFGAANRFGRCPEGPPTERRSGANRSRRVS